MKRKELPPEGKKRPFGVVLLYATILMGCILGFLITHDPFPMVAGIVCIVLLILEISTKGADPLDETYNTQWRKEIQENELRAIKGGKAARFTDVHPPKGINTIEDWHEGEKDGLNYM